METALAHHADGLAVSYRDIFEATKVIYGHVLRTPTLTAPKLSELTGAEIYVKYENLQITGSFKDRGALVKMLTLTETERARGVIAMSAGNHAQAVASRARLMDIPALIVMPEGTPNVKVSNTEAFGAQVVLAGQTLAEAQTHARQLGDKHGLALIHPYDDPHIIAGQGTVGMEMLEEHPDLDCAVMPIGGGGLIAGSAIAMKKLKPSIEIIGIETELYPSMKAALCGDSAVCGGKTLAEGIAVKNAGALTVPVVRALVSSTMTVNETTIERAISAFLSLQKIMAEGAGAAGLAALMAYPEYFRGRKVGLVLSGGNIDVRMLASILERGLERDDKIISLRVVIDDQPGMLGQVATLMGEKGANILEVSHRRMFLHVPAKGTALDVRVETKNAPHAAEIIDHLERAGFSVIRLKD